MSAMGRKRTLSLLDGASSGSADNPPIASISRIHNPLFFCAFQKLQRHQPAKAGACGRLSPSRRKGGSLGRRTEAAAGAEGAGRTGTIFPAAEAEPVESRRFRARGSQNPRWSGRRSSPSPPVASLTDHPAKRGFSSVPVENQPRGAFCPRRNGIQISLPGEGPDAPPTPPDRSRTLLTNMFAL